MPSGIAIQPDEIQQILDEYADCRKKGREIMESYRLIGTFHSRDPKLIQQIVARHKPTTDLAKMYFRSKAYRMAKRIVAKGSPSELIDILERPGIGVLDTIKKIEGGTGGFFLTVNAESCGAVKVGVLQPGAADPKQLESGDEEPFNPFADIIDVGQERAYEQVGNAQYGPSEPTETHAETVIARVKRELAEARRAKGTESR